MYLNAAKNNSYLTQTGSFSIRPSKRTLSLPGAVSSSEPESVVHNLLDQHVHLRERVRQRLKKLKDKKRL